MAEGPDEELLEALQTQVDVECKIKDGAENLLSVFSQSASGFIDPHVQKNAASREQLRKQVQEELDAAEAKIAKLRLEIDVVIQRMDSQRASTSRERLDHVSPTALGLQQERHIPLRKLSKNAEDFNWGENDVFAIKSHALAMMQILQSFSAATISRPTSIPLISTRSFSTGAAVNLSPKNKTYPMGPPITPSMTRTAQRSRAAAMASSKSGHNRTPSHATGLGDVPRKRIEVMSRLVEVMRKSTRLRYELPVEELIACAFPCLADQAGKEVRASAYRLLRHAMVRPPWKLVRRCRESGLDLYLARTFLRDLRFDSEKEQALKLIRTVMECGCSDTREEDLISVPVIRALVAAADHGEEKLRHLYVETLTELTVLDTSLLIRGEGLSTVLQTLTDGPYELAPSVISLLLTLVDLPGTRKYFRPGFDLEVALSNLTEARDDLESLQSTSQVVSIMLRSWPGLFYLSLYQHRSIKSLVLALRINSMEVQEKILDMLCSLLSIKGKESSAGITSSTQRFKPPSVSNTTSRLNLYDHYLALLVLILIECGLVEAIVHVLENRTELSRKATLLMGHLTQIAAHHLPSEYGVRIHALPDLFRAIFTRPLNGKSAGGKVERDQGQEKASQALSTIDRYEREQARIQISHTQSAPIRSTCAVTSTRTISPVDETTFRSLMLEANVLNTKDYTKWNIDTLIQTLEAFQGHSKRLEEAIRVSKLFKRVLAFFYPFSLQYSTIASTNKSQRYTKLGCLVLGTLLNHGEGVRLLADDKLLKEIRESLLTDLMASQRTKDTLTVGYFEMLGVLTRDEVGRQLMHKAKVYTALYRAVEEHGSEDMINAILQYFDFSSPGHCCLLLSKILTTAPLEIRNHTTQMVADMIRVDTSRWLVSLLVNQLYDTGASIRELASTLLLQLCSSSTKALEMIVSMRPMLEETSHSLLLKFISTPVGLRYLLQGGYVDREIDEWFNKRNYLYTIQLEVLLARGFSIDRNQDDQDLQWDGCIPPHFYGELAKTPDGCAVLQQKGHFVEFAHFIRTHAMEEEDVEVINKVKSTLWAVGNIGATEGGLSLLEGEDLIKQIVQVAQESPVFSLRGTCYFVLGLISSTQQGAELVEDHGWITLVNDITSYCIPPPSFLHVQAWKPMIPFASVAIHDPESRIERIIMLNISNLGNSILANKASRTLAKIKSKHHRLFIKKGVELFTRSLFISDYHFLRQAVRRYIWELFEIKMDQSCVDHILEARKRLLSGKKPIRNNSLSASASASDLELRRQGDEVLGIEGEEGNGMDEEGGDYGDDDDDDDDEEDEEDLDELEEGDEEEQNGMSSFHRPLSQLYQNSSRFRDTNNKERGISTHHQNGPNLTPRRKLVGGFTLTESLVEVES